MSIWTRNGKLIVNENGKPIECDRCPCDGETYAVYLYYTYTCNPETVPGENGEPVAKELLHYVDPEFPEQDNGEDFYELREKKPYNPERYLPAGWYSECSKYDKEDGNFFYTYDDDHNLHTWFYMGDDCDRIDFINPVYNLQYMKEKVFEEVYHRNLFECEAESLPEIPENAKQWLRIIYSPNGEYTEWTYVTETFSTAHPFCPVPFGEGETISWLAPCGEEETDYEHVWKGGTMCPADGVYSNEEERNEAMCPIVVDIPYEVCGELSEELIERAAEENMPDLERMEECEPMCALFLVHQMRCPDGPPNSDGKPKEKKFVHYETLENILETVPHHDFFIALDESPETALLPEGWYSLCDLYDHDHSFTHFEETWYYMDDPNPADFSDAISFVYHLSYVPHSYLREIQFDTREIPAKDRPDFGVHVPEIPAETQWLRITYSAAANAEDWSARYDIIHTTYPFIDVPFGDGEKREVRDPCKKEKYFLGQIWGGGCMAPYQATYDSGFESDEHCPVVCDIKFGPCGEIPLSIIEQMIEEHKPDKDEIHECLVSYDLTETTRTGQTMTSLHTEVYDVTYVHHREEYDGEVFEWDEPVYDYLGIGATVTEEINGQAGVELGRWYVPCHHFTCYDHPNNEVIPYPQTIGPFCDEVVGEIPAQADAAAEVVRAYHSDKDNFRFYPESYYTGTVSRASVSPDAPGPKHAISYEGGYSDCYYGSYATHRFTTTWKGVTLKRNSETAESAEGISFIVTIREYVRKRESGQSEVREIISETEQEIILKFDEEMSLQLPDKFDMVHVHDAPECTDETVDFPICGYPLHNDDNVSFSGRNWKKYETYAPGCCVNSGFNGYYCEDNTGSFWSGILKHGFEYSFRATGYTYRSQNGRSAASVQTKAAASSMTAILTATHAAAAYRDIFNDLNEELKQ